MGDGPGARDVRAEPRDAPRLIGRDEGESDAAACHLLEEERAGQGEDEVCAPDSQERSESLPCGGEGDADGGEEIVDEYEEDGKDGSRWIYRRVWRRGRAGTPTSIRTRQANGIGEAPVELDAVDAGQALVVRGGFCLDDAPDAGAGVPGGE